MSPLIAAMPPQVLSDSLFWIGTVLEIHLAAQNRTDALKFRFRLRLGGLLLFGKALSNSSRFCIAIGGIGRWRSRRHGCSGRVVMICK